jgi:hypothetical protein
VSDCSPSVLVYGTQFRMYYECSPTLYHPSICLATSDYGTSWKPTAVVIPNPLPPWDGRYGIGHPSAIADPHNPAYTLLYYYDSTYYPNQYGGAGMVYAVSLDTDGRTIRGWSTTSFPFPAKVKYYPKYAKYLATAVGTGFYGSDPHWFGTYTSDDAFTFTPAGWLAVPGGQLVEDAGQLIADQNGWIQSSASDLQALIAGGPNQFSAQIYLDWFNLNLP